MNSKTVRMIFRNVMFDVEMNADKDRETLRRELSALTGRWGARDLSIEDVKISENDGLLQVACGFVSLDPDAISRDACCTLFSVRREMPVPMLGSPETNPEPEVPNAGEPLSGRDSRPTPVMVSSAVSRLPAQDATLTRLRVTNEYGLPLAGRKYAVVEKTPAGEGCVLEGEIEPEGMIEVVLPRSLKRAELRVFLSGNAGRFLAWPLEIGAVPSPYEIAGVQVRLNHLGFDTGGISGRFDAGTAVAVHDFQQFIGHSEPDGALDEHTRLRLNELYDELSKETSPAAPDRSTV